MGKSTSKCWRQLTVTVYSLYFCFVDRLLHHYFFNLDTCTVTHTLSIWFINLIFFLQFMVFLAFYKNHIKVRNGDTATFMTANSGRQLGKRRKLTHKKKTKKQKTKNVWQTYRLTNQKLENKSCPKNQEDTSIRIKIHTECRNRSGLCCALTMLQNT